MSHNSLLQKLEGIEEEDSLYDANRGGRVELIDKKKAITALKKVVEEIENNLERVNMNLEHDMCHDDIEYHKGIKLGYEAVLAMLVKEKP